MIVKVLSTTDGKYIGEEHDVLEVSIPILESFGLHADSIVWNGDYCTAQNTNYTLKLKKLEG